MPGSVLSVCVAAPSFAEVSGEDARKEHPRRTQTDAPELQASQRHPHHANEGEYDIFSLLPRGTG